MAVLPNDGRFARCVVKGVSLCRFEAKFMNVELIGVITDGPVSAVGEAISTMCSRRLTED